jgi:hypothetical protein
MTALSANATPLPAPLLAARETAASRLGALSCEVRVYWFERGHKAAPHQQCRERATGLGAHAMSAHLERAILLPDERLAVGDIIRYMGYSHGDST